MINKYYRILATEVEGWPERLLVLPPDVVEELRKHEAAEYPPTGKPEIVIGDNKLTHCWGRKDDLLWVQRTIGGYSGCAVGWGWADLGNDWEIADESHHAILDALERYTDILSQRISDYPSKAIEFADSIVGQVDLLQRAYFEEHGRLLAESVGEGDSQFWLLDVWVVDGQPFLREGDAKGFARGLTKSSDIVKRSGGVWTNPDSPSVD